MHSIADAQNFLFAQVARRTGPSEKTNQQMTDNTKELFMTTIISIPLNIPQGYGVAKLTQKLTEYSQRIIAEDSLGGDETDEIALSHEMVSAVKQAEQDYREGKCVTKDAFNQRFAKWL